MLAFWFIPIFCAGMLNQIFLRLAGKVRRIISPYGERNVYKRGGRGPGIQKPPRCSFTEVLRIDNLFLHILAYSISVEALERVGYHFLYREYKYCFFMLAAIGIYPLIGYPLLVFFCRCIIRVQEDEIVVRNFPFSVWKRRILIKDIERCDIWNEPGLLRRRFQMQLFGQKGVLIYMVDGSEFFIPSKRSGELLSAIHLVKEAV